jgi:hypothetical protein
MSFLRNEFPSPLEVPWVRGDREVNVSVGSILLKKWIFSNWQNFPDALVRSPENYMGGTREQSDFQPAGFVDSLQGIGVPIAGFDGRLTRFGRHPLF